MKIIIMMPLQLLISVFLIFPVCLYAIQVQIKPRHLRNDLDAFAWYFWDTGEPVGTGHIILGSLATFRVTFDRQNECIIVKEKLTAAPPPNTLASASQLSESGTFATGTIFDSELLVYSFITRTFYGRNLDQEVTFELETPTSEETQYRYAVIEYFEWEKMKSEMEELGTQVRDSAANLMAFLKSTKKDKYNFGSLVTGRHVPLTYRYFTGHVLSDDKRGIRVKRTHKLKGFIKDIKKGAIFIRLQVLGVSQDHSHTSSAEPSLSWLGLHNFKSAKKQIAELQREDRKLVQKYLTDCVNTIGQMQRTESKYAEKKFAKGQREDRQRQETELAERQEAEAKYATEILAKKQQEERQQQETELAERQEAERNAGNKILKKRLQDEIKQAEREFVMEQKQERRKTKRQLERKQQHERILAERELRKKQRHERKLAERELEKKGQEDKIRIRGDCLNSLEEARYRARTDRVERIEIVRPVVSTSTRTQNEITLETSPNNI